MDCLKSNYLGGRLATFSKERRSLSIELAQIPPQTISLPFSRWSLTKLAQSAMDRGIVTSITAETVRVILNEAHITYKTPRHGSNPMTPNSKRKKRIESLYNHSPQDGWVICVDEFGSPLEVRPYRDWRKEKKPKRLPADYTRKHGVRHLFAAYDLKSDKLYGKTKNEP